LLLAEHTVEFEAGFPFFANAKEGRHSFLIPLSTETAQLLGQVLIYWGAFEHRIDLTIQAFLDASQEKEPEGWRQMNFKRRRTLFKDLAVTFASAHHPQEVEALRKVFSDSGELHWRRNVYAHGYYALSSDETPNQEGVAQLKIVAHATVKGQKRSLPVEPAPLTKLWHDISHLTGDLLTSMGRMGARMEGVELELVVSDTDLLRQRPHPTGE
jgi:hypothetical protein